MGSGAGGFPPDNIFQKGYNSVAIVELPGMDKSNIEIQAKENTSRISGQKVVQYDQGASIHRRERI